MTVLRTPKHAAGRLQTGVKQPTGTPPGRRRPTRVDALIRQVGKVVTSITTPDGVTLRFGESERDSSDNSWDEVLHRASH
jgi:hypothetical protein